MFLDDLISVLVAANIGTYNTNIFKSSQANIPSGDGPYLSLRETGGTSPKGTHNAISFGLPGYVQPGVQLIARAKTEVAARSMIASAYAALTAVGQRSQLVNSVWWVKAVPLQEPFDLGMPDSLNRICFVCNFLVTKRPNAAMSQ